MSRIECSEPRHRGFTLIELLVSMIMVSTMMIGVIEFFLLQHRTHARQEQGVATEENLRLASSMITDALRNARYAAPSGSALVTNVFPSLTSNPLLVAGANSTTPDSISVAACFKEPVAHLAIAAVAGATVALTLDTSVDGILDTNTKSLVRIGESELAKVTSVTGSSITVDTSPPTSRPVQYNHPIGANVCRVDRITFSVANNQLLRNDNQGVGQLAAADNIALLKITLTPPKTYSVVLTAQPSGPDPVTGAAANSLQRTLSTTVTLRN